MRETLKVAIAVVLILSIAVVAGVVAYMERPLPAAGVAYLNIAYVMKMPGSPTVPHKSMVEEIISAFKAWYRDKFGANVVVRVSYEDMLAFTREIGIGKPKFDVWWGGTVDDFSEHKDILLPFNSTQKEALMELLPNATVLNCHIMDVEGPTPTWYAWCLYAPCLLYEEGALPSPPTTWDELAHPRFENKVIVPNFMPDLPMDPFLKPLGLVIYAYEAWKLGNESLGWSAAWNTSVLLWAIVEDMSGAPLIDALRVVVGDRMAMLCSDVIAYHMLIEAGYPNIRMRYLNASLVFPCPVGVLKGCDNEDVAKAFVDFLISAEGQAIVAKHLMPIRPDVSTGLGVISPFSPEFPAVGDFNRTFVEIAEDFIYDYMTVWLVQPHGRPGVEGTLRDAWWWIKRANETREANENATRYFNYAWANFTAVSWFVKRSDFDQIYNATDGWKDKGRYMGDWGRAAQSAYINATENARRSIEAAENATALVPRASGPGPPTWGLGMDSPPRVQPGKGLSVLTAFSPKPCQGQGLELGCSWPGGLQPRSRRYQGASQLGLG